MVSSNVVRLRRVVDATNNSLALIARDNALAAVKQLPYFANFKRFATTKQLQLEPQSIPYCGVYLISEAAGPDGDPNAGPPKFTVEAKIGFSVWIMNNDPEETELQLDGAFRAIMNGLLCFPTVYNDEVAPVEGFPRYARSQHYGNAGLNNELPIAEMRLELTFKFREYYEFVAHDDLRLVHLETMYPSPDEAGSVQQITAVWDIPVAPVPVTAGPYSLGPLDIPTPGATIT